MKYKLLCFIALIPIVFVTKAQTGGPGQPEFMQFQQAGTKNLVNPSNGSFSYQIHLFTIGGYPMNLTYQSGVQMTDVSSMVGLGWNLNAGSIVRTLRGLPDDFLGDKITKQYSVAPNETFGGKADIDLEIAGLPQNIGIRVGAGMGVFYNTYKGWGLEPSFSGTFSLGAKSTEGVAGTASLGMGVSVNSQSGVDAYLSPSIGLKMPAGGSDLDIALGKSWSVNSNEGLKSSFNASLSYERFSFVHSDHSYLNNSYQPDIEHPFVNSSGTYSGAFGGDIYYLDPGIRLTGYFSKQQLSTTSQDFQTVGAMHEGELTGGNVLMDFNREKKLPYYFGQSKILPIPYKTPDVFNLNAQGISMSFSLGKNDVGVIGDAESVINSSGNQIGLEVNLGNLFKAGVNLGLSNSVQKTGTWNPTNLAFKPAQDFISNNLYQRSYFKNHAEINLFNHTGFTQLGGYDPVKFNLQDESSITQALNNGNLINNNIINTLQPARQSYINYLTADEAGRIGFDKQITSYDFSSGLPSAINRVSDYRVKNHLSEISVTQSDGMKYVFGIPVYNTTQKEVSFSVGKDPGVDFVKNLVAYLPGTDNSASNTKGIDHYFEATTTPAYVTQFLITAVLSPDYRDIKNDGITDDDIGNYVKFSYFKEDFHYRWRTPVAQDSATYNKGFRSDDQDDKGSYVYGEKELWYIRAIESKTEIAEFHYSRRNDGLGVTDENGGKNPSYFLRKLDSIVIYSLSDRRRNRATAIPLKTIHFDYNYSLCSNIDNGILASNAKLSLSKLDFTYERSAKGKLTPYIFKYGELSSGTLINPSFNTRNVNRWGYYQDNGKKFSDCDDGSPLSGIDYPYASQDKIKMDTNAYAWNLTNITIPGGGKLKVDYEAHDYAYVQDKTAGQMFIVSGFNEDGSGIVSGKSFGNSNSTISRRIYFKLFRPINNGSPILDKAELLQNYIQGIKDGFLYYKFYVRLRDDKYDYVTGYAKVADYGVSQNRQYGYVELAPVNIDDDNATDQCNPIQKSALQFMRINRNMLLFDNDFGGNTASITSFVTALPDIIRQLGNQIASELVGVNKYFRNDQNYCSDIDTSKSFIRLFNPIKMKLAGGSRVKQISIDDDWDVMTGNKHENKSYTTSYDYTTTETDPVKNTSVTISSGVADYEPLVGGDEISLKQPVFYSDKKKFAPDNDYYVEEPVNESLFPAPQITYSKVTQVTNPTNLSVGKTGKIVNEFFTARDYPVKVSRTTVDEKRDKTDYNAIQPPFVAIDQEHDFATVSQGYSIELNNASGLPKSTWVYDENGDRVSGEVSEYFQNNDSLTVIDRNGNISKNNRLGISAEYTVDGRKSFDQSVSTILQANLNVSMFGIFPIPIIMPLFSQMTEKKQFQSLVVNKVFHRNVILKSRTVYDQGSASITENLAFDPVTGQALLTKTANEFNDSLYSFNYPAWWMYKGMGPSYVNERLIVNNGNLNSSGQFLLPGDELRSLTNGSRLWVEKNNNAMGLVNENGYPVNIAGDNYQLYNSGAKNLLNSSAGQIVTWKFNPLEHGNKVQFGNTNILNSSAIEYYDDAVKYCSLCDSIEGNLGFNHFLSGKKGNFKVKQNWFYLAQRTPGNISNGITNVNRNGLFNGYHDFWNLPANNSSGWSTSYNGWEWKEKINLTDVDGMTVEKEDRIGRKTTNLTGYQHNLLIAQADNAAYGESYFDGFEDYLDADCPGSNVVPQKGGTFYYVQEMKRVKLINGTLILSKYESHTGKYSLQVDGPLGFTVYPPVPCKTSGYQLENGKGARYTVGTTDSSCNFCQGGFYPAINKKYIFSCWVKVNSDQPVTTCSDASVVISGNGIANITLRSEGPVIEGWQRILGAFNTPANNNAVTVQLNKGTAFTFFDDLRIFPANGNLRSYVYDDVNLRLTYSLDENNYFTKNEYNNQGELIRVKKETEKGIVTIKEANSSLIKQH